VAEDTSIVGSIGVIFQYPQLAGLMDKLGVSVGEIKSAPLKGEPSPFHAASPAAQTMIRSMISDTYGWFVDLVASRRHLAADKAKQLSDGSVFTGRQALGNGLIDALGGERAARDWLAGKGIARSLPVVDWKRPDEGGLPFLSRVGALIFQGLAGDRSTVSQIVGGITDSKLFLDGLISVWQVGRDPSNME
jgi:protease-4